MSFQVSFDKLLEYDLAKIGIALNVKLSYENSYVEFEAKIDTGSTYCVFERNFTEKSGIIVESGLPQRFDTANGSFLAYGHYLLFRIDSFEFEATVFFAENETLDRNVLGRHGWLDRVIVGINDYEGKLYLKKIRINDEQFLRSNDRTQFFERTSTARVFGKV